MFLNDDSPAPVAAEPPVLTCDLFARFTAAMGDGLMAWYVHRDAGADQTAETQGGMEEMVEHLQGKRFWSELDTGDFGLLTKDFKEKALLLDRIIDRVIAGQENLDIIRWALDWHISTDDVHDILDSLNINSKRLCHRFDG